jgi:hypothetical protein
MRAIEQMRFIEESLLKLACIARLDIDVDQAGSVFSAISLQNLCKSDAAAAKCGAFRAASQE